MDDLISRQSAIDALDVLCQEHRYKIPGKRETYSQYNEAWQDALDRAEGAIFNLPSAQPEQRWIPCSERLPEERGFYLTTTKDKAVYCDYWNEDNFDRTEMVIAWMPLPEAYRGGKG